MKGKGKGGGDKGEKQDKDKGSSSSDNKDVVLQFPDIRPVDHVRLCPRYTSGKEHFRCPAKAHPGRMCWRQNVPINRTFVCGLQENVLKNAKHNGEVILAPVLQRHTKSDREISTRSCLNFSVATTRARWNRTGGLGHPADRTRDTAQRLR